MLFALQRAALAVALCLAMPSFAHSLSPEDSDGELDALLEEYVRLVDEDVRHRAHRYLLNAKSSTYDGRSPALNAHWAPQDEREAHNAQATRQTKQLLSRYAFVFSLWSTIYWFVQPVYEGRMIAVGIAHLFYESYRLWKDWHRYIAPRLSQFHLDIVRKSLIQHRSDERLAPYVRTYDGHQWHQASFLRVERVLRERFETELEELERQVSELHYRGRAPDDGEREVLFDQYVATWNVAAMYDLTTEEYLSQGFPSGAMQLRGQQEAVSRRIADCRVALLRAADPNYRW